MITVTEIKSTPMTLQFFAKKPEEENGRRYRAVNTISAWLWNRNQLPKDLIAALQYLIPELKPDRKPDEFAEYCDE